MNGPGKLARVTFIALFASLALTVHAEDEINDGRLHFLTEPPASQPHYHSKRIVITQDSLETGWVNGEQCHYNLDQVRAMEVVFGKGRVRNLKILRHENIEKVWVEDNSVQLENVGEDAHVCIGSQNRILQHDADGVDYMLLSGPYMRRFFDGYFPMKVDLTVDYPEHLLELHEIAPAELKLQSASSPGHVKVEALFEGRLLIGLHFSSKNSNLIRPTAHR